jgi:6-pyruvoyltetrahydropterin/6-carboxytetrahydropterin synthase
MAQQTITRKGTFDAAHRVMNERMKCFNIHGHCYMYELEFEFSSSEEIGYAIDFKEIKRVACQWIDDMLDHGSILNPEDTIVISACNETKSKLWLMSLNGKNKYCNPSVENIAKEIFIAISILLNTDNLKLTKVVLYETPNCYTECIGKSITDEEKNNFFNFNFEQINNYKKDKGKIEYDDRKF